MQECLHKAIKFGTLAQMTGFKFLLKFIEIFWNYKACQKIGVGGNCVLLEPNIFLLRQSRTKYLEQNGVVQ